MADANEMYDAMMEQLSNEVISDVDEPNDETGNFSSYEEVDFDDIPTFLLSYVEASKSRATIIESHILKEPDEFTASLHTEDGMNLPIEPQYYTMKVTEQIFCEETEKCNASTDSCLFPTNTETEALLTRSNRGEDEKHGISDISLREEEEKKKSNEDMAEQLKKHSEYIKTEERRRQTERDFQKELRTIMETEKLHQKELELMERRAQEKLEKEFLLQQEMISNLQRRVEEERRMTEEELKRIKDEEDKRKQEEENKKIEAERKRMEEEARRKVEEEERKKIEIIKVKKEAERKRVEEKRRRMEREEMRRRGEEEGRRRKDEVTMMTTEENGKKTEEEGKIKVQVEKEKRKKEEEIKNIEEESKELDKKKKEKRESEGDMAIKKEEGYQKEAEKDQKKRRRGGGEEENIKTEREGKVTDETHERTKQERIEKREEDKPDARKQMIRDTMYGDVMKDEKRVNELEESKKKEDTEQKTEEEEVAGKRVKETVKVEVKQAVKRQEGENRKMDEELRFLEDGNQKKEGERKTEENCRKPEEEMGLREDKEECKELDTGDSTRQKEERREAKPDRRNMEAATNEEDTGTNKNEQVRLKEKEEIKQNVVQDREMRTNMMQEQAEHDGIFDANEKNNMAKTENLNPVIAEVHQEQQDLDKTSSQQDYDHPPVQSSSLSEHIEKKRLSWMKDCIPYTKLSLLQSRRRREASAHSQRRPRRRTTEAQSLPPLCLDSLLQSRGWKSLQEVTMVSLQDLPGCNLSTLAQCTQLQSLSLRHCGLKSLEGINQLSQLCYVDAQENDISFVDCENMTSLRVLQLSHNKLTSIHGLAGVENLNVLDLSHNFITRIAGLESAKRLQRLLLNHNQLISTKGLRDVSTLLHLNCSHNHLASVEGLENSALLHTLDLRANSLTEPPGLNNQVLLRELNLDDNSISSLQGLAACWLPLLQRLSVAQNRITQLHSLSETVSLESLDLRFNCLSEPQNVCESLRGCHFLQEVRLVGNPLQQESSWRSMLQKAVPGLRAINDWQTDSPLSPPADQEAISSSGSFLVFCQTQLQQTADLQQQHSRELSEASSSLDAVQTSCRHLSETLQLATEQRFAHEIGDTTVVKHEVASKPTPEKTLDMDSTTVKHAEWPDPEVPGKLSTNGDNIQHNGWTFEEKPAAESRHDTSDTAAADPRWPTISKVYSAGVEPSAMKRETEIAPASNHHDQDIKNTAAVVIQQLWRKYRQKCGNISGPSTAEKGGGRRGDGPKPKSGPSYINGSVVGQDYAATVIQALWRGFSLRRRLTSALAAVTSPDAGEDDTFEEVDVDEFVFDEAALEKQWMLPICDDLPSRCLPVSEQPLSLKPLFQPFSEPPPPMERRSKQAWVSDEQVDCDGHRTRSPASASAASGLSERSEKILEEWGFAHSQTALQMLKRAQNMKSKKHQQKKLVPSFSVKTFCYQSNPEETWNIQTTQTQHNRKHRKAREAEKRERLQQERAQRWLHVHPLHSDGGSVSVHFLPEISSDVLNGGRVQLIADPGYTEHLHHASGLWASGGLAARPRAENNRPGRNSLGHTKEAPSPEQDTSAPSKKERISFRDNPVQLSGGWGGGKKRDKVRK